MGLHYKGGFIKLTYIGAGLSAMTVWVLEKPRIQVMCHPGVWMPQQSQAGAEGLDSPEGLLAFESVSKNLKRWSLMATQIATDTDAVTGKK